jgi:hypothetical protein
MSLSHSPKVVTDGLVLYLDAANQRSYPKSGTTWSDLAGANNGTLNNMENNFDPANKGSLSFDGSDDNVEIANSSQFHNQRMTASIWINPQTVDTSNYTHLFWKKRTNSPYSSFGLWLENSTRNIYGGFGQNHESSGSIIPLDEWTFVSLTYDGSYRRIFLNGLLDVETADSNHTIQYDSNPILLGYGDYNLEFNGRISIAQIYNRALTGDEVRQNYLATRGRYK